MSIGQATLREATEPGGAADTKADKTGANPINFQDTFILSNEYIDLGDAYTNSTYFEYRMPLQENTLQWRTQIPMTASDLSGDTKFGLGDISTRFLKTVKLTPKDAWILGLEAWFDTASDPSLGTGNAPAPVLVPPAVRIFNL